jgi:hypothetical protein
MTGSCQYLPHSFLNAGLSANSPGYTNIPLSLPPAFQHGIFDAIHGLGLSSVYWYMSCILFSFSDVHLFFPGLLFVRFDGNVPHHDVRWCPIPSNSLVENLGSGPAIENWAFTICPHHMGTTIWELWFQAYQSLTACILELGLDWNVISTI